MVARWRTVRSPPANAYHAPYHAPNERALLIDDEPLARMELRRLLQAHPNLKVVGEADTLNAAQERLGTADYDVVFLDIQLRGGTGFELLEFISPNAEIIFVTAERLAGTLRRVEESTEPAASAPHLGIEDSVFVKTGATTRFVPVAHIVSIGSCATIPRSSSRRVGRHLSEPRQRFTAAGLGQLLP